MPDLIGRLAGACCPGGPAGGDRPADGDVSRGRPMLGRREQPAVPGKALARDDVGNRGLADPRGSDRFGRPLPRSYSYLWCRCAGSSARTLGAAVTPACRRTLDPVPTPAIHSQPGSVFLKCRPRVMNSPWSLCDSTCRCTFTDSIVADSPALARARINAAACREPGTHLTPRQAQAGT